MRRAPLINIALVAIALLGSAAQAAGTPADAIKYRKSVMSAMGAHVGAFVLINFGRVDHPEQLKAHADALANLAAEAKGIFPAGSDVGDTDALPLLWKEPDQVAKLEAQLEAATAALRTAAAGNDKAGISKAFKDLGETCKGCHDRYRKEQMK